MLNLSHFSLHFDGDSWSGLHEALCNLESVLVVIFGSLWSSCLGDLAHAMRSYLAWRVYPACFLQWIVELTLNNFFLYVTQCYAPSDTQLRYPGAPDSLLHQSDVVQLLRALVQHVNPTYPNHLHFLTEVAPNLHELFPLWQPTKQPPPDDQAEGDKYSLPDQDAHAPRTCKKSRLEETQAPKPCKRASPCLRHLAALFKVPDAPPCRDGAKCPYVHHTSERSVPIQVALDLLSSQPPRTFSPAITDGLSRQLTMRASPVATGTMSDK